jgi:hypothetical protein
MDDSKAPVSGYLLAAALGTMVGGIGIAIITRAFPKMMSRMMSNMMQQMGGEGCNPEEM